MFLLAARLHRTARMCAAQHPAVSASVDTIIALRNFKVVARSYKCPFRPDELLMMWKRPYRPEDTVSR
jgi:hypothetical protein